MSDILIVNNLKTKFYTIDGIVHAVNGVSFNLEEGETLAIVGESGCGKSVTMLSLLKLLPSPPAKIEGGKALFKDNGASINLLSLSYSEINRIRGRKIGMIFQDALSALNPVMKVGRQISESLINHLGLSKKESRERAIELLEYAGISYARQRYHNFPHQFSGGMRQRAMIAIAISCNPRIIIADEPTTALDVTIQAQIVELIKRLQNELGISVIWITHDLGVVAGIADRVMVMYSGKPVEIAPVYNLYEHPQHPYTVGLLSAIPKMGETGSKRLVSIGGTPPDLLIEPRHCQFAWRCPFVFDPCWQKIPDYVSVGDKHLIRCFYDIDNGKPRND
ncbi:Oligopeptide transport ATP-binding protein OppD [subsurface metagenome]